METFIIKTKASHNGHMPFSDKIINCISIPAARWGPVAARTQFTPALPDFPLTNNNNNNSLKGFDGMEKWQTGLRAMQFYFSLWRHY